MRYKSDNMETLIQFKEWLSELLYRDNKLEDYFQFETISLKPDGINDVFTYIVYFYTKNNRYCMVAKNDTKKDYFGCQVSSRKPRAGEIQFRGNDLADGKFNDETWNRIKNDIISYELVKVAKKERSSEEVEDKVNKDQLIYELFKIIDDIDTASDMFKDNYEGLSKYVYKKQQERWKHIKEDFVNKLYDVFHPKDEDKSDV